MSQSGPDSVLAFWFEEAGPKRWWRKDSEFDALIRERFGAVHAQAVVAFGGRV